ncbi:MAG TPA: hypothetical protein VE715_20880 [Blastocatellia bacterium]|nr:hypothetical protein [Blastocatellia bacterium]
MGVNRYLPYVFVLPEDEKNRQLANGFWLELDMVRQRQMQVLQVAGGWPNVVELFKVKHIDEMKRYLEQRMVLLIDFDDRENRFDTVLASVPNDLRDKVFILGAHGEPEGLQRAGLGFPETIGSKMAKDCREDTDEIWGHDLLRHNASELDRLREHVHPILFQPVS